MYDESDNENENNVPEMEVDVEVVNVDENNIIEKIEELIKTNDLNINNDELNQIKEHIGDIKIKIKEHIDEFDNIMKDDEDIDTKNLNEAQKFLVDEFNKRKIDIMNSKDNRQTKRAIIDGLRKKLKEDITFDTERRTRIDTLSRTIKLQMNDKSKERYDFCLSNQPDKYVKKSINRIKIKNLLTFYEINEILDNCIKNNNANEIYKEGKELFYLVDPDNKYPELCEKKEQDKKRLEEEKKNRISRSSQLQPLLFAIDKLCNIDNKYKNTKTQLNTYVENYIKSNDNEITIKEEELYNELVDITNKYVKKEQDKTNILNLIKQ